MALFTLSLTNNSETIDFLDSTTFKVMDGGFDIGTPSNKRTLAPIREGFYIPLNSPASYRESTIKFSIHGTTRSNCISSLQKLQRIINSIHRREFIEQGRRGQLSYAWSGATNVTYFEVFGADFIEQPDDILSVEKIHRNIGGDYVIPDLKIKLYLSAVGYGLSIYSAVTNELQLSTAYESAKTGGVGIENAGNDTGNSNWVQIASTQVPGSSPYIIKLYLQSGSTYSLWNTMYITHQIGDTSKLTIFDVQDGTDLIGGIGSLVTDDYANYNSAKTTRKYFQIPIDGDDGFYSQEIVFGWDLPNQIGTFLALLHSTSQKFSTSVAYRFALGYSSYWDHVINYDWISSANYYMLPLGIVTLPPGDKDIYQAGNIESLKMGFGLNGSPNGGVGYNTYVDYLELMPANNGVRILTNKTQVGSTNTGIFIDDYWQGLAYYLRTGGYVSNIVPLMSPIFLEPATTQRLYFHSCGYENHGTVERGREFTVKLYAVPTYETLAE